jgi:hypothetical protein
MRQWSEILGAPEPRAIWPVGELLLVCLRRRIAIELLGFEIGCEHGIYNSSGIGFPCASIGENPSIEPRVLYLDNGALILLARRMDERNVNSFEN